MVYHKRSKGTPPSLPSDNSKGKKKVINDKVLCRAIEKKFPSDELVSNLVRKVKKLEEEVLDMREWAKF